MAESYDDLIGKPYCQDGTGPDCFDCFGLACEVLRRLGYPLDQNLASNWIRRYTPGSTDPEMVTEMECDIEELPRKPGDMLVMRGVDDDDKRATHVAIHIGENLCIQATRGIGVHIVPFSRLARNTVEVISWTE